MWDINEILSFFMVTPTCRELKPLNNTLSISQKSLIVLTLIVGVTFAGFMGFLMYKTVSLMQDMTRQ